MEVIKKYLFLSSMILSSHFLWAHSFPDDKVWLTYVNETTINGVIEVPLTELETVLKKKLYLNDSIEIKNYFKEHLKISNNNGLLNPLFQNITIKEITFGHHVNHQQLSLYFTLKPSDNWDKLTVKYDALVHQIVNRKIDFILCENLEHRQTKDHTVNYIGTIKTNIVDNTITTLDIDKTDFFKEPSFFSKSKKYIWALFVLLLVGIIFFLKKKLF